MTVVSAVMAAGMMFCFADVLVGFPGMCDECNAGHSMNIRIFISLLVTVIQTIMTIVLYVGARREIKDGGTVNTALCGVVNIILSLIVFLCMVGTGPSTHGAENLLLSIYWIVCLVTPVSSIAFIFLNVAAIITANFYDTEKWRLVRAEKEQNA